MPTVGGYQVGAITAPVNNTSPIDANEVTANDNAIRTKFNNHDADATIHIQSSVLASRPAASVAGRFWVTSDGLRAYYDSGSAWGELAYATLAGTPAFTTPISVTSTTTPQATIGYDGSNKFTASVSSAGAVTLGAVGASAGFTFSGAVTMGALTATTGVFSGAITLGALGGSGTIGTTATAGMSFYGKVGSVNDLTFYNGAGGTVLGVATGGVAVLFAGAVTMGALTTGAVTLNSTIAQTITTSTNSFSFAAQHAWNPSAGVSDAITLRAYCSPTGGTQGNVVGLDGGAVCNGAANTTLIGVRSAVAQSSGTAASMIGVRVEPSGGTCTNSYGLDIDNITNGGTGNFAIRTGSGHWKKNSVVGGIICASAALATNATDGFLYVPTCAGTPTGVPGTQTGTAATVYDSTNNKLYVYNGAWKGVTLA